MKLQHGLLVAVAGFAVFALTAFAQPVAGDRYEGHWFKDQQKTRVGYTVKIEVKEAEPLKAVFTFAQNWEFPVCNETYIGNGRVLNDGRIRFEIDRSVKADGSESRCGTPVTFIFKPTGSGWESNFTTLRKTASGGTGATH